MDKIAFIFGETFLYWSSIILTLAVLAAIFIFLALYVSKSRNGIGAALVVPMCLGLSLVLSRLVHWYCRVDAYTSFETAMTNYSIGGYALMGVFFGCVLAACLLRLLRIVKDLPEMLDCMALAGGAGIAVGRLSFLFNSSDKGMMMDGITSLPLAYPVTNAVTGATEYRLATFMLQAMVTAGIFLVLIVFYLVGQKKGKLRGGDTALLFLAAYGASQIVFDSTRYDSLYFRSNGFVSIVQILGAVGLVLAIVIFSVRMVKALRWKTWFLALWIPMLALLGGAGYMEYHVQRHGDQALFAYSVMGSCLVVLVALTAVLRLLAVRGERKNQALVNPTINDENGTA